ncbi:MAG: hypothetical protein ACXQT5_00605, partial [Candidatus Syntropharchaeia archaeon]
DEIRRLTNIFYEVTKKSEGMGFLYVLRETHRKEIENELMNICDVVFEIELEKTGTKVISKFYIPKIRRIRRNTFTMRVIKRGM